MAVSVFDLFKIGIGPSSSHTVGPMRAALLFAQSLEQENLLQNTASVRIELFGSLSATGRGHGTDRGVLLGLSGEAPDTIEPSTIPAILNAIGKTGILQLLGYHAVPFTPKTQLVFSRKTLPGHPNALTFQAMDAQGMLLKEMTYFSVGGGFVVSAGASNDKLLSTYAEAPYAFTSARQLLQLCNASGLSIAQLMMKNECVWRSESAVQAGLLHIWEVMQTCVKRGCGIDNPDAQNVLPGGFNVKRRAPQLYQALCANRASLGDIKNTDSTQARQLVPDSLQSMDWLNVYAMAVNEENAAGARVVTAPTNGAAGIVPAVLHYYQRFIPGANVQGIQDFLLTAGAIGILYKLNASISGAEVGCQGEVGVACSMAAGGLAAVLGGTAEQIENAAEIGMEHNLGLTCDPVGGMVQIPCIERNAMGAVKALNAARIALQGDGTHRISLDSVIKTMRETGADMKTKYKETSRGGLAVNIVEC